MTRAPGQGVRLAAAMGFAAELLAATLVVAGLGVFHVWTRTQVVTQGYALGQLQREHDELQATNEHLKLERSWLRGPTYLNKALHSSLSKLGLAPPDRGAVWAAGPGRTPTQGDGTGRAGVDGVGDRPRPAEPAPSRPGPTPVALGGARARRGN